MVIFEEFDSGRRTEKEPEDKIEAKKEGYEDVSMCSSRESSSDPENVVVVANFEHIVPPQDQQAPEGWKLRERLFYQGLMLIWIFRLAVIVCKMYLDLCMLSGRNSENTLVVLIVPTILYSVYRRLRHLLIPALNSSTEPGIARDRKTKITRAEFDDLMNTEENSATSGCCFYPIKLIKSHLDVIFFLVKRVCCFRKPKELDKVELQRMQLKSDELEWFFGFYGSLAAITLQANYWPSDLIIPILFPLVSLAIIMRRRNVGFIYTLTSLVGFSFIGFFRLVSLINAKGDMKSTNGSLLILLTVHSFVVTIWLHWIALKTRCGYEQINWTLEDCVPEQQANIKRPIITQCDPTSALQGIARFCQTMILFGLPSFFFWPTNLNLKLNNRLPKYLVLILLEHLVLCFDLTRGCRDHYRNKYDSYPDALDTFFELTRIFLIPLVIMLIIALNVSSNKYLANANEYLQEVKQSGIYYRFCSTVFKMPTLRNH